MLEITPGDSDNKAKSIRRGNLWILNVLGNVSALAVLPEFSGSDPSRRHHLPKDHLFLLFFSSSHVGGRGRRILLHLVRLLSQSCGRLGSEQCGRIE